MDRQLFDFKVANGCGCVPGGNPQRSHRFLLPPDVEGMIASFDANHPVCVDPDIDPRIGDPQADTIPVIVFEIDESSRFILVGALRVDIGKSNCGAAPATQDE